MSSLIYNDLTLDRSTQFDAAKGIAEVGGTGCQQEDGLRSPRRLTMRLCRECCVAYEMDELDGAGAVPLVAIYRGRRYYLITSEPVDRMWLESMDEVAIRVQVAAGDRDLILNPTEDDLHLAAAYERGEINAFEYPDGHTYPPNRETGSNEIPDDGDDVH